MNKLNFVKKTWVACNVFFVCNYSLYLLLYIVRLPLSPLPTTLNTISLIISYSTSLTELLSNISAIPYQDNFYCIIVFLTFPSNILLLPFYLLSIYHLITFVLSNKKRCECLFIYNLCLFMSSFHVLIARLALFMKILCVPSSLLMFLIRSESLGTVLAFMFMVRQQFFNNTAMRSVFGEVRTKLDEFSQTLPSDIQNCYVKIREFLIQNHQIKKD